MKGNSAKRAADLLLAFAVLPLVFIPMVLVAGLVAISLGRPVLFRQTRPGLNGRPFEMIKFRTMRQAPPGAPIGFRDAERLSRLGRFLRSSSLDELPELWNVIKGDMSLVGPRPLLMQYLPLYDPVQLRRHEARPGITGLAQVSGRNALSWEEKFRLDVWYVDHHSLWLDFKIMLATLGRLLDRRGVSAEGHATMPTFIGSDSRTAGRSSGTVSDILSEPPNHA